MDVIYDPRENKKLYVGRAAQRYPLNFHRDSTPAAEHIPVRNRINRMTGVVDAEGAQYSALLVTARLASWRHQSW